MAPIQYFTRLHLKWNTGNFRFGTEPHETDLHDGIAKSIVVLAVQLPGKIVICLADFIEQIDQCDFIHHS